MTSKDADKMCVLMPVLVQIYVQLDNLVQMVFVQAIDRLRFSKAVRCSQHILSSTREYVIFALHWELQGSDNIISFTTARYFKQPLIIRGPGAGADVTAAGVFSDLLRLAAYLGAPS